MKLAEYKLAKECELRDEKIKHYENYINRFIDRRLDINRMETEHEERLKDMEKEISKKDEII